MHTYRDALDGVRSVRVLFPGSQGAFYPSEGTSGLDGIGAIALRPGNEAHNVTLQGVVDEILLGAAEERTIPAPQTP